MRLEEAFSVIPRFVPEKFDQFAKHVSPEVIEDGLIATGTATLRRRRLPVEAALWLVIGMALMRNESMARVAAMLGLALPSTTGRLAAPSAFTQARKRLGEEPLEYVFTVTGKEWAARSAEKHRWHGLGVYAMDGSTLRVPDSPENWDAFGGQEGSGTRAGSAYPTVRLSALMAVRSHVLSGMKFGSYKTGETTLARELWAEVPANSVLLVDRGFLIAASLTDLQSDGTNRHWVTRAKSTLHSKNIKNLGVKGDDLIEIQLSESTRRKNPGLPERWVARAIQYRRKGFKPSTILTSLLDAEKYPPSDVVALYHERWEIELGYDEIKTHMLAREETIRSRTPELVRQEIWAIGLAYNLVRVEMERIAEQAGVPPTRLSFVNALSLICHSWIVWSTPPLAPGRIPSALSDFEQRLQLLLLPERRPERRHDRVVKIKMSKFKKKWVNRAQSAI